MTKHSQEHQHTQTVTKDAHPTSHLSAVVNIHTRFFGRCVPVDP